MALKCTSKDDKHLHDALKASFGALETQTPHESQDKKVLKQIRKADISKLGAETRLLGAQWLIMHHSMEQSKAFQEENEKRFKTSEANMKADMPIAWEMLFGEDVFEGQQERVALFIASDVAKKLDDYTKVSQCFERIMKNDLNDRELMIPFTTAPELGNWAEFIRLGEKIEKSSVEERDMILKQMPQMAPLLEGLTWREPLNAMLEASSPMLVPNFGILFDRARALGLHKGETPAPVRLTKQNSLFRKCKLTLREIVCGTKEEEEEIRKQFENDPDQGNIPVENLPGIALQGSVLVTLGFNPPAENSMPTTLAGPFHDEDHLVLEGHVDSFLQRADKDGNPMLGGMDPSMMAAMGPPPPEMMGAANGPPPPEMAGQGMMGPGGPMGGMPMGPGGPMGGPPMGPGGPPMGAMPAGMEGVQQLQQYTMAKLGQLICVRQTELIDIKKSDTGYKGTYTVASFTPEFLKPVKFPGVPDQPISEPLSEAKMIFDLEIECDHLKPMLSEAEATKNRECESKTDDVDTEKISTGIDDLYLD
eukprot:465112_1